MDDFENEFENNAGEETDSSDISSELIRGHINTIILRTLIDGEKYGTEIIDDIEKKSNGMYSMKQPTLYSALKRLEAQGLLTSYWGGVSTGGRRRYFSLTEKGMQTAIKNTLEWEQSRSIIDSLISEEKNNDSSSPAEENIPLEENEIEEPVDNSEETSDPLFAAEEASATENPAEEEISQREKAFRLLFTDKTKEEEAEREPSLPKASFSRAEENNLLQEPILSKQSQKASFSDDDYHRFRKQSQFDGEYRSIIDSIFDSADSNVSPESKRFNELNKEDYSRPVLRKKILKETQEVYDDSDNSYNSATYNAFSRYSAMTGQPAMKAEPEPSEYYNNFSSEPEPTVSVKKMSRDGSEIEEIVPEEEPEAIPAATPETVPSPIEEEESTGVYIDENDDDVNIDFSEIRRAAREEKIKIYFAGGDPVRRKIPDVTFNKGVTLFRSSLVVLILSLLEAIPVMFLKDTLQVTFAYPILMIAIPLVVTILFGVLAALKFGNKTRKEAPMQYFTASVIVFIIAVLGIASYTVSQVENFSNPTDTFKYLLIPCIYSFNVVIFALVYYALVKRKKS